MTFPSPHTEGAEQIGQCPHFSHFAVNGPVPNR